MFAFKMVSAIEREFSEKTCVVDFWRGEGEMNVQSEIVTTEVNRHVYFYYAITPDASVGSESQIHHSTLPTYSFAFLFWGR